MIINQKLFQPIINIKQKYPTSISFGTFQPKENKHLQKLFKQKIETKNIKCNLLHSGWTLLLMIAEIKNVEQINETITKFKYNQNIIFQFKQFLNQMFQKYILKTKKIKI